MLPCSHPRATAEIHDSVRRGMSVITAVVAAEGCRELPGQLCREWAEEAGWPYVAGTLAGLSGGLIRELCTQFDLDTVETLQRLIASLEAAFLEIETEEDRS